MQARKTNLKWFLIGIVCIVSVAIAGLCCGCNASSCSTESSKNATPQGIVDSYFTCVDITYIKDSNEINFTVNSDKVAGKDVAYSFYSNRLVNCISDLMRTNPDLNIGRVTIESVNVPNVIVCDFDSEKIKAVEDWDSFNTENLKDLCTSYSDCMN